MSLESKLYIRKHMTKLDLIEHSELFDIVKHYSKSFTATNTGALVSSDELPDECIKKLMERIAYFLEMKRWLKEEDVRRSDQKRIE